MSWFRFVILGPDVSYYNGAIVTSPSGKGVILTGGEYPINPYYCHTSHQMMELGMVSNKQFLVAKCGIFHCYF